MSVYDVSEAAFNCHIALTKPLIMQELEKRVLSITDKWLFEQELQRMAAKQAQNE